MSAPLLLHGALASLAGPAQGVCLPWRGQKAVLLPNPTDNQRACVTYVAQVLGLSDEKVMVAVEGRDIAARAFGFSLPGRAREAELQVQEVAQYFNRFPASEIRARLAMIATRAASRARAERHPAPASLRRDWGGEAVEEHARHQPWAGFFTVEDSDLAFRRFDGTMSAVVNRAGFVSGDAAIVLPYDPERDLVLLVEQFRFGPFLRHDPRPWSLEPIAGRIDGGESPEDAARREALEEAGVTIDRLVPASANYPSPGANSEFFYLYIALCALDVDMQGAAGLDEEQEDIRSHVVSFERLMELVSSGEANCGPLVLLALWLAQNRSRLRAQA